MKERYLTREFVEEMHDKYFRAGKMPRRGRAVVLGIDLQNYFLKKGNKAYLPSAHGFLERLIKFYEFAKLAGVEIILTRHCHEAGNMVRWWHGPMTCDSEETEIVEEIKKLGDKIIEKRTYDAFHSTALEEYLRERKIRVIISTGVMTHLCCETTAREAFVRGFDVIFPIDGTLTQNHYYHEGTLRAISHGFAPVPTLEEVEAWLKMR